MQIGGDLWRVHQEAHAGPSTKCAPHNSTLHRNTAISKSQIQTRSRARVTAAEKARALRDFGTALLITKEFQAMGATPCEMAREVMMLCCDAIYRDEWESVMRNSWARVLFRLHVRRYNLRSANKL